MIGDLVEMAATRGRALPGDLYAARASPDGWPTPGSEWRVNRLDLDSGPSRGVSAPA